VKRDQGIQKAMADPRYNKPGDALDGKRMIFGGFEMIVES